MRSAPTMLTLEMNDNRQSCRLALSPTEPNDESRRRGEPDAQFRNRRKDPVFLVCRPDAIAGQSTARLAYYVRDKHRLRGMPLGQHRYHITVCGFCEFADLTDEMIAAIGDAVTSVGMPPFLVGLDYVEKFPGGAVVLRGDDGLAGVMIFRDRLAHALRQCGLDIAQRSYTPHLTLLYDPRPVPTQAVEEIRWTARECVLVHSPQGQSRHIPIARWPLALRVASGGSRQAVELVAASGQV